MAELNSRGMCEFGAYCNSFNALKESCGSSTESDRVSRCPSFGLKLDRREYFLASVFGGGSNN